MKIIKSFLFLATVLLVFSCTPEESIINEDQELLLEEHIVVESRNNCTESGNGVTFTIDGSSITMDAVDPSITVLTIHNASDYGVVETLCVPWTSDDYPNCGPGIISDDHPNGNYLLKVKTSSGFDWMPFSLPCNDVVTCDPVDVSFPGGGVMNVDCIDPSVYRLDVHDLSYGNVASICNPWGAPTYCTTAPFTQNNLPTGNYLLRVESPGSVVWLPITIN